MALYTIFIFVGAFCWGYLMVTYTDASFPYIDSFVLVASLVAQWFLAKKYLESWMIWIIVDVVAITIYALNEYRNDIYGSHDSVFYIKFNYCGDSGQNAEEYSSEGFGEIINFNKQNNLILLTIETSKCSEFNSYRHDEVQQEYRSTPNQFYLQIEILPKNKLKINSFNSPKICPLCWDLRNVIFSPLKWSR
jgi:hypothetical protein